MKTAASSEIQFNASIIRNKISFLKVEVDTHKKLSEAKFYQKIFVVLIGLSTFLIFPESPKELENICNIYNSRKVCNVW